MSGGGGGSPNSIGAWLKFIKKHYFDLEEFIEWSSDWGISRALILGSIYAGLYLLLAHYIPSLPLFTFNWLVGTAPVWLPIALLVGFWRVWVWYIQSLFLSGRKPVLLEVKMPREITKSPRAMEQVFTAFSLSSGETTFLHRGWKGQVRPFFSFEIASFGGQIHFYIWCWSNYKNTVEAAMYAQYPEVELIEVEDYATKFQFDPAVHSGFATDWRKESYEVNASNFRINAYPIKTYVDFELEKDPKEEFKIDPLAQIIEFMGSIRPEEQIWAQIVIRKCGKIGVLATYDEDTLWKDMVKKEVDRIRTLGAIIPTSALEEVLEESHETYDTTRPPHPRPSWRHQQLMQSMERNLGKYPFEVGMRGIYFTTGEMRGPYYTGNRWLWRPFGNPNFQTHIRPRRWHNPYDYPWQDFHDFRWNLHMRRFFDAYRRRLFYHSPWVIPTNIFTNEELASIWHPPSSTIATPGIQRIPATKAAPPANLPM